MKWEYFVVHCSAGYWGTSTHIRQMHLKNGWREIGYNAVILNGVVTYDDYRHGRKWDIFDGAVEVGRPVDADTQVESSEIGAHVRGHNGESFGVCLIGHGKYTMRQFLSLRTLFREVRETLNQAIQIRGHYEFDPLKGCPLIDMDILREYLLNGYGSEAKILEKYIEI